VNIQALKEIAESSQAKVVALQSEIEATQQQWETVAAGDDIVEADNLEAAILVLQQDLRRSKAKAAQAASNFEDAKAEATRVTGQLAADACSKIEENLVGQLAAIQSKADELHQMLACLRDTFTSGWEEYRQVAKQCGIPVKHLTMTAPQFDALQKQLARPEGIVRAFQMRRAL
jgi:SMC interacting uncharacterized protein involved in chromosome segregation